MQYSCSGIDDDVTLVHGTYTLIDKLTMIRSRKLLLRAVACVADDDSNSECACCKYVVSSREVAAVASMAQDTTTY